MPTVDQVLAAIQRQRNLCHERLRAGVAPDSVDLWLDTLLELRRQRQRWLDIAGDAPFDATARTAERAA